VSDTDAFRIQTSDGLSLETVLQTPDTPGGVFVFCHPHPQMGGTMNAPLMKAVAAELLMRGWAVLRFNFRGIGASEGQTGIGIDEVADAEAAIEEAHSRFSDLPVAIGGWSFGAAVAGRVASQRPDLAAYVAIAPAVTEKPGITAGLPPADEVRLPKPSLIVVGVNDELVEPTQARDWAEGAGARFEGMKGANHFFWGKYDNLATLIGDFLDQVL
jgi:uncharacterized protein